MCYFIFPAAYFRPSGERAFRVDDRHTGAEGLKAADGWRLIDSPPGSAAWNMAVDEALLLQASEEGGRPTLRFFTWDRPSLSIGSFQKTDVLDLKKAASLCIPLVRRPTGGRAVLHDKELTYSVACPIPSRFFPSDLMGSYKTIGACFLAGLRLLGVDASLVPVTKNPDRKATRSHARDPLCFSSPSWYEVLAGGRKLIGSAQRRLRGGFLQQGSLLIGLDIRGLTDLMLFPDEDARRASLESLESKMTALSEHSQKTDIESLKSLIIMGFNDVIGASLTEGPLTPGEVSLAEKLYEEKYSTDGWNLHRMT
jgi:lipoate-protein ligase A